MLPRSEAMALVVLAAICVLGIIVLSALGDTVPAVLGDLAFGATGAAAGAALPRGSVIPAAPVVAP